MNKELQNKIVQEFGLGEIEEKAQAQLVQRISGLLMDRLVLESLSALDDAAREKFEAVVEQTHDADKIIDFLQKNVPDFYDLWDQIFDRVKTDYKTLQT